MNSWLILEFTNECEQKQGNLTWMMNRSLFIFTNNKLEINNILGLSPLEIKIYLYSFIKN